MKNEGECDGFIEGCCCFFVNCGYNSIVRREIVAFFLDENN